MDSSFKPKIRPHDTMKRSTFIKSILTAIASLFVAPYLLKKDGQEINHYPDNANTGAPIKAGDKFLVEGDKFSLAWEDGSFKSRVIVTEGCDYIMKDGYIVPITRSDKWAKIHGQPSDNQKHLKWLIS